MYQGYGPVTVTSVQASWFHVNARDQSDVANCVHLVDLETGKKADVRTWISTPWTWPGTSEVILPTTRHN